MPFSRAIDRTLASAPLGMPLRIVNILFDTNRQQCAGHGVYEGDEVSCLKVTDSHVLVDVVGRGPTLLDLPVALSVEVEAVREPAAWLGVVAASA